MIRGGVKKKCNYNFGTCKDLYISMQILLHILSRMTEQHSRGDSLQGWDITRVVSLVNKYLVARRLSGSPSRNHL